MASWIVHLRVAEKFLEVIDDLDRGQFGIGSVAPDSGIPDEKWEKFDPPAEILHFQPPNKVPGDGARRCNDLEFYQKHLRGIGWPGGEVERFSFYLGYFFHLIVDNLWNKKIGEPTAKLYENKYKGDYEDKNTFFQKVKGDWYSLDFVYVRGHPESFFWQTFLHSEVTSSFLDFLPEDALKQRVEYIKTFYQRDDEGVDKLLDRPYEFLSKEGMDAFVEEATQTLIQIYELIWLQGVDVGTLESALQLVNVNA
jgi:hypothetical protein